MIVIKVVNSNLYCLKQIFCTILFFSMSSFFYSCQVLDSGTLVEFDHPYVLLQNPSGSFNNFIAQLGPAEADRLTKIAKESYEKYQMAANEGKVSKSALEKRKETDEEDAETKEEDIAEVCHCIRKNFRFTGKLIVGTLNGW